MKKDLTELVFILDRSGSMCGLESDTVGGFNALLQKQKKEAGEALVSVVLFDDESEVLWDRLPVAQVPAMTEKDYTPGGCTALLDAVGGAIHHIGNVHKYIREEDRPEKTLFVITTDGQENASCRYSCGKVKTMIEKEKKEYGWEFLFLGANMDAVEEAKRFGIEEDRAATYLCDCGGIATNFEALGNAVTAVRCCGSIDKSWKAPVEEDRKRRSGKN